MSRCAIAQFVRDTPETPSEKLRTLADGSSQRSAPSAALDSSHPATALRSVVVEYPDRPNRQTICPRALSRDQVMVTWLTADSEDFIDLWGSR